MSTITLENIRAAAERLAAAHVATTARASLLQDEIKTAVKPIYERHRSGLDAAAEEEARARDDLQQMLDAAPQLFKKPRSIVVNGVRSGYRKEEDSLYYADEKAVIARIRALFPEQADLLVRTEETLVSDALTQLDAKSRSQVGISLITGADKSFITIGDSDVEKLAKTLISDAIRRVGEEETAPKAKKGKAKIKEVA
ncbi:hypothetical protein [Propionivibrio dicarboxylicus]|uniref:Uncharacterized protein n=1 Tax=Propionivibrio dicarboxylicus TaxID=83767 RepID=A0A1G8L9Z3_9RHOO|nr:hypothetical protein [Propionivibrio dicarboxylicus]SDI52462.1 hypothetical protein SAMN05660652_03582 [Propionivibrio dicarboxylicus]